MHRNTQCPQRFLAAAALLAALLAGPTASATDGHTRPLRTPGTLDSTERSAALTASFDRDARRIIRESRDELRAGLDASLRAEFALALVARPALAVKR